MKIAVILIVICLSLCGCGETATSDEPLFPETSRVQIDPEIQYIIDQPNPKIYRTKIAITAYDHYDLRPIQFDSREHGGKSLSQISRDKDSALGEVIKENLSEQERAKRIAEINAEYDAAVEIWKSYRTKEKYDSLIAWLSERGVEATLKNWSENDYENARVIMSLNLDILIALRDNGPYICYYVDFANELYRPLKSL